MYVVIQASLYGKVVVVVVVVVCFGVAFVLHNLYFFLNLITNLSHSE